MPLEEPLRRLQRSPQKTLRSGRHCASPHILRAACTMPAAGAAAAAMLWATMRQRCEAFGKRCGHLILARRGVSLTILRRLLTMVAPMRSPAAAEEADRKMYKATPPTATSITMPTVLEMCQRLGQSLTLPSLGRRRLQTTTTTTTTTRIHPSPRWQRHQSLQC